MVQCLNGVARAYFFVVSIWDLFFVVIAFV